MRLCRSALAMYARRMPICNIGSKGARTNDAAPHCPLGEAGAPQREFSMQIRALAFISIFVVAGAARADAAGDASAEIAKCAGISDPAARLKCFDAAAPRANGAPAAQPAGEAPRRDGFGFSAPEPVTKVEVFGQPP